jgi:hypothetical protein
LENSELHVAQCEVEFLPPVTEPPEPSEIPGTESVAETAAPTEEVPAQISSAPETEHPVPLSLLLAIAGILFLTAVLLLLKIRSR